MGNEHEEMNVSGDTCSEGFKPSFRKPYVLTKQREAWSPDEHNEFLKAIQLYNRDWKKIEAHIGTKTVVQIRSHAQKWFQKTLKSGNGESVPPPRPKRKTSELACAEGGASADSKLLSKSTSDGTHVQGSVVGCTGRSERKNSAANKSKNKGKDKDCTSPTDPGVSSRSVSQQQQKHHVQKQQKVSQKQQKQDALMSTTPGQVSVDQSAPMEPPNLCLVYSYLGSLFDPKFDGCDFALALQNMQASDRLLSVELMDGLSQRLAAKCRLGDGVDQGPHMMDKLEGSTHAQPQQQQAQQQQQQGRRGKRPGASEGGNSPQRPNRSQGQGSIEDPNYEGADAKHSKTRKAMKQGRKKERTGMMSSSLDSVGVDMASMGMDKEMEREFALFEAGMTNPLPDCQGDMLQDASHQWDCRPDVRFDNGMGGIAGDMTINIGDLGQLYCTSKEDTAMPSTMQQSFSGCSRSCGSDCSSGSSSGTSEGDRQERSGIMTSNDLTKVASGGAETGTG